LSWVVKDSKRTVVALRPSFSSHDPKIASVSEDGVGTSAPPGKTTILPPIGDIQGGCEVDVNVRAISRLEIRPATALVRVGDSQHFQVTAYGPDGIAIPDVAAAFKSSDPSGAAGDSGRVAFGRRGGAP